MTIEQQLEKARIWAYWSLIGLVVPVAGLIASAVSLSILNRLLVDQDDADVQEEMGAITQLANTGKTLSILIIVVTIVGAFFIGVTIGNEMAKAITPTNPYVNQENQ